MPNCCDQAISRFDPPVNECEGDFTPAIHVSCCHLELTRGRTVQVGKCLADDSRFTRRVLLNLYPIVFNVHMSRVLPSMFVVVAAGCTRAGHNRQQKSKCEFWIIEPDVQSNGTRSTCRCQIPEAKSETIR